MAADLGRAGPEMRAGAEGLAGLGCRLASRREERAGAAGASRSLWQRRGEWSEPECCESFAGEAFCEVRLVEGLAAAKLGMSGNERNELSSLTARNDKYQKRRILPMKK